MGSAFTPNHTVSATFWTGCPRNDLRSNGTFALVERHVAGSNSWEPAYDDDDYSLKYSWHRPSHLFPGHSLAKVEWEVPPGVEAGVYRLRHFGAAKPSLFSPAIEQFTGVSGPFIVLQESELSAR
jgi:neutral ceramidase